MKYTALVLGTALWAFAGWSAAPREVWDTPAFLPAWGATTLLAGVLGLFRDSRPWRETSLLFLPLIGVLAVQTILTGGSASLLPLGMILVGVLALPGLLLAWIAKRLTLARR